jgi:hypothetical protein
VGDDDPVADEIEVVREAKRLVHVVGDDDRGRPERVVQRADEVADHIERDRVEPGEGLVVDDELGVERDGARERRRGATCRRKARRA